MLAAVLNSPNYLSPDRGAEGRQALLERYDYVLRGMVSMGNARLHRGRALLRQAAGSWPRRRTPTSTAASGASCSRWSRPSCAARGFDDTAIDTGGLRVETTFTRKAMRAAEDGVLQERPQGLKKLHVATASVDVKTGALVGFYGGQNYLDSQLNWARLGGSPGSAFKPFALWPRLKAGFALKDTFDGNSPYELPDGGGEVGNQGEGDGRSYGSAISLTRPPRTRSTRPTST